MRNKRVRHRKDIPFRRGKNMIVYCSRHGTQPAFTVPGLTSGYTCALCI